MTFALVVTRPAGLGESKWAPREMVESASILLVAKVCATRNMAGLQISRGKEAVVFRFPW